MNAKTPLQAIVSVICDCLHDLPPDDQARALEAAKVTLGLQTPRATQDMNPYQEVTSRPPLPRIEVEMRGDRPVVTNQATRQLPAPRDPSTDQPQAARGYVHKIR